MLHRGQRLLLRRFIHDSLSRCQTCNDALPSSAGHRGSFTLDEEVLGAPLPNLSATPRQQGNPGTLPVIDGKLSILSALVGYLVTFSRGASAVQSVCVMGLFGWGANVGKRATFLLVSFQTGPSLTRGCIGKFPLAEIRAFRRIDRLMYQCALDQLLRRTHGGGAHRISSNQSVTSSWEPFA